MDYIRLYKAANANEAHFIKGLMKKYSIDTKLLGEGLSIAMGELPLEVMQVEILVHKKNLAEAKEIIYKYEEGLKVDILKEKWTCNNCSNLNPSTFEICWKCNQEK